MYVIEIYHFNSIKESGGGQNFSTSFWMWFSQAPLCRYRYKFIFDDIIFLLSGNIIEYICFWRFNSIIMTWNEWLVFTKSVIMGLNNISPWPCPLLAFMWMFSSRNPSSPFPWRAMSRVTLRYVLVNGIASFIPSREFEEVDLYGIGFNWLFGYWTITVIIFLQ